MRRLRDEIVRAPQARLRERKRWASARARSGLEHAQRGAGACAAQWTFSHTCQGAAQMNARMILPFAIALAIGGAAYAAEGTPDSPPAGAKPTKQERADARAKRRAEMAAAQKKNQLAQSEQDKAAARKPVSPADKAARAEKRAEVAKDNKAGKMPTTNEGGTTTPQK
jgi:hypothetical protein